MRTPCPGLSMRRTPEGHAFLCLHWSADERMTAKKLEALKKRFSSQAHWDKEMEMRADALSGQRVYPEFDPAVHVVADERVPRRLTRYCAIDPHPRTPTAVLWVGIDEWSDWWAYREIWPSKVYGIPKMIDDRDSDNVFTVKEYAEMVAALEGNRIEIRHAHEDTEYGIYRDLPGGERIVTRYMDQAGKAFRASGEDQMLETLARRYARYGISCRDPRKAVDAGEDAVHALLEMRWHNVYGYWPRLHIAASLKELIFELGNLRYKVTRNPSDERELKQQPAEARKHLVDCLRYLALSNAAWDARLAS